VIMIKSNFPTNSNSRSTITAGKERKTQTKRKALILQPVRENFGWVWPQLEVKQSGEKGAGQGLFATVDLLAGTVIPYLGNPQPSEGLTFSMG
jgi:hypothetical protein